jgi:hypothetical protein
MSDDGAARHRDGAGVRESACTDCHVVDRSTSPHYTWYNIIPPDWSVAVSKNSWTTNEMGLT